MSYLLNAKVLKIFFLILFNFVFGYLFREMAFLLEFMLLSVEGTRAKNPACDWTGIFPVLMTVDHFES